MRRMLQVVLPPVALAVAAGCAADAAPPPVAEDRVATIVELAESGAFTADGSELFSTKCAMCHGADGGGAIGPKLGDGAVEASLTLPEHVAVVLGGRSLMPSWADELDDDEVAAVVTFERTRLGR